MFLEAPVFVPLMDLSSPYQSSGRIGSVAEVELHRGGLAGYHLIPVEGGSRFYPGVELRLPSATPVCQEEPVCFAIPGFLLQGEPLPSTAAAEEGEHIFSSSRSSGMTRPMVLCLGQRSF